ncbi:MAG: Hsp20/alpha crystallin family protein [Ruminococcus sp.]|nr:Hsp20/alpha crystallin family protein [Ruminococcus sp.]
MLYPDIFNRNVFDDFFDLDFPQRRPQPPVQPMKTDVKETAEGYELAVDLPGVKKEDVKAELNNGYLTVSATVSTNNDEKDKEGKYIRRERYTGSYSRSYFVGDQIKEEDIKAKFENGVLILNVPKKDPKKEIPEKKFIAIE